MPITKPTTPHRPTPPHAKPPKNDLVYSPTKFYTTEDGQEIPLCYSQEQYRFLRECSEVEDLTPWNEWREKNPNIAIWLEGVNLQGRYLQGADLYAAHCQGTGFVDAHCQGAIFSGADCQEAIFSGAHCQGTGFVDAHCQGAEFVDAQCQGANFMRADCQGAKFVDADCQEANFMRADCQGAEFVDAQCQGAEFVDAHCQGAIFWSAHCQRAIFVDAHCQRANFIRADCQGADFRRADCQEANFMHAHCQEAIFSGAQCQEAKFWSAHCQGAIFDGAHCQGAEFVDAQCRGANFWSAQCQEAIFSGADCQEAIFSGAQCQEAKFVGAHCQGAIFTVANVSGGTFININIDDATDFTGSNFGEALIYPEKRARLEHNMRCIGWKIWYKERSPSYESCSSWQALCSFCRILPVRGFWWISDYGYSTTRILGVFLAFITLFAVIYTLFPTLLMLNGKPLTQSTALLWLEFLQMFFFAASTMVTLGFSNINVNTFADTTTLRLLGMFVVTLNLMVGYFMLAVLVTRLAVLFQTFAPGEAKKKNVTKIPAEKREGEPKKK